MFYKDCAFRYYWAPLCWYSCIFAICISFLWWLHLISMVSVGLASFILSFSRRSFRCALNFSLYTKGSGQYGAVTGVVLWWILNLTLWPYFNKPTPSNKDSYFCRRSFILVCSSWTTKNCTFLFATVIVAKLLSFVFTLFI